MHRRRSARPWLLLGFAGLVACGDSSRTTGAPESVLTYVRDVAPILRNNCVGCHRPGQGAPFNLLTYNDARDRADDIVAEVTDRRMPPWLPAETRHPFIGTRRLADADIATLRAWVAAGAPEGRPQIAPLSPVASAEAPGPPDLWLEPTKPYVLEPVSEDVFRNLVIRTGLATDRYIHSVTFDPGDAPIHHAVVHLDHTSGSRRHDGEDGAPGFAGMSAPGSVEPEGHFIGWAPGRGPIHSADGRPWRLAAGTDLVLELHLMPQRTRHTIAPRVGLSFADGPGQPPPLMLKMGVKALEILPGARGHAITDRWTLPADVTLLSVYPHAHHFCRTMDVTVTYPDGREETLLRIPQWSFHWQQDYRFSSPVTLPAGSAVQMRYTYDNTTNPPRRVLAGPRSSDEMANLLLQVVPRTTADAARLRAYAATREAAANVAAAEMLVRVEPRSATQWTFLGASYVEVGRVAEGLTALERARALDGALWNTRNELAGALLRAGRLPEAVQEFREASRLAPANGRVQFNLARALLAAGERDAGRRALEQALSLEPDLPEAHHELGAWWFANGRLTEAVRYLRRAVALAPESALALSDLGGALAQAGQRDEARQVLERALSLDPGLESARVNLQRLGGRRR